jgi:hypothetical protein
MAENGNQPKAVEDYEAARLPNFEPQFGGWEPPGPPLQPPPGGGDGGMEARVARLEADVSHIKSDISDLKKLAASVLSDVSSSKVELGKLGVRVDHLPGKGFIVSAISGGVVLLIGVLTVLAKLGWLISAAPTPI